MNRTTRYMLPLALAMTLSACQQQSAPSNTANKAAPANTPAASTPTPTPAAPATPPPAATTPTPTPTAAPTSADSTGIPECDAYINKYEACLNNKVPAESRAMMKQGLDQSRESWKTAVSSPGVDKSSLAATCKQMTETAKTSMAAFGCTDF